MCAFVCFCLCVCVCVCCVVLCVCVSVRTHACVCMYSMYDSVTSMCKSLCCISWLQGQREARNHSPSLSFSQVIVPEGKETDRYLNLFKGKLIIHNPAVRSLHCVSNVTRCHVMARDVM